MAAAPEAADLLRVLARRGETLAVAESLTGGLLAATITGVPGASAVFRGAVVSYATDLKVSLLGVPAALPATVGVVSAQAAEAMAVGARGLLVSSWALSTTGVAGPEPREGKPVGLVYVGWAGPDGAGAIRLDLRGTRADIRRATCGSALVWLRRRLAPPAEDPAHQTG